MHRRSAAGSVFGVGMDDMGRSAAVSGSFRRWERWEIVECCWLMPDTAIASTASRDEKELRAELAEV